MQTYKDLLKPLEPEVYYNLQSCAFSDRVQTTFQGLEKSFEIRDECGMFYYRILFVVLAQNKTLARKIPDTSRKRNDLNPEYEAETLNPKLLVCGDRLSRKAGHFTSALVCFSSRV